MYGRLYRIKPNLISFELQWGLPECEKAKFRGHVRLQKRKVFAPLCVWRVKAKPLKWLTDWQVPIWLLIFYASQLFLFPSTSQILKLCAYFPPRLTLPYNTLISLSEASSCLSPLPSLQIHTGFLVIFLSLCVQVWVFPPAAFFFISSHIRSILMPLSLRVAVHFIVLKVQRGSIIALAQNKMIRLFHLCMTDPPWWNEIIYKNNLLLNYGPLPISASDTLQL